MINWEFVEQNKANGVFKVDSIEQGREFLAACNVHRYTWSMGENPMTWRGWEERFVKGATYFRLCNGMTITYGVSKEVVKEAGFEPEQYVTQSTKESIYAAFKALKEANDKFEKADHEEFCEGHGCRGECELCGNEEVYGYTCYTCQISEILRKIERVLDNHKWPEDAPKVREMTVAEISKQLGYEVKIVKED